MLSGYAALLSGRLKSPGQRNLGPQMILDRLGRHSPRRDNRG